MKQSQDTTKPVDEPDFRSPNQRQLDAVSELTAPSSVAQIETVDMVKVKSPLGATTDVPAGIVDSLLESGYKRIK